MAFGLRGLYWNNDWTTETDQTFLSWDELQKSSENISVIKNNNIFQAPFGYLAVKYLYFIDNIRSHAIDFITTRLAPAFPKNDGKQTPMKGHPVFIAQHATATCCRGCLWKWYQIEKGRPLTDDKMEFVVKLVLGWIGHPPQYSPHS